MIERTINQYTASYKESASQSEHSTNSSPKDSFKADNYFSTKASNGNEESGANASAVTKITYAGDPALQKHVMDATTTGTYSYSRTASTSYSNGNNTRNGYTENRTFKTEFKQTVLAGKTIGSSIYERSTMKTDQVDAYRTRRFKVTVSDEEGNPTYETEWSTVTEETNTTIQTTLSDDTTYTNDYDPGELDFTPRSVWFSILRSTTSCNASYTTRSTISTSTQHEGESSSGVILTTESIPATGTVEVYTTMNAKRASYEDENYEFPARQVPASKFKASYQTVYEAEANERLYARKSELNDYGTVMSYGTELTRGASTGKFEYKNKNGSGGRKFTTHPFRDVESFSRTLSLEYAGLDEDSEGSHFDTEVWELVEGGFSTTSTRSTVSQTINTGIYYPRNSTSLGRSSNGAFVKAFTNDIRTENLHLSLIYDTLTLKSTAHDVSFSTHDDYLLTDPHSSTEYYGVNNPDDEDYDQNDARIDYESTTYASSGWQQHPRHDVETSERQCEGIAYTGQITVVGHTGFQSAGELGTAGKIYRNITDVRLPILTANKMHPFSQSDIYAWGVDTSDGTIYAFSQDYVYSTNKYGDPDATSQSRTSNQWKPSLTDVNNITASGVFEESDVSMNFLITQWTFEYHEGEDLSAWRSRSNAVTGVELTQSISEDRTVFYAKSHTKSITGELEWDQLEGGALPYGLEDEYSSAPIIQRYSSFMPMRHTQYSTGSYFPHGFILSGAFYEQPIYFQAGGLSPNGEAKGYTFVNKTAGELTCTLMHGDSDGNKFTSKKIFNDSFGLQGTDVTTVKMCRNYSMQERSIGGVGDAYIQDLWDTGTFYIKDKEQNISITQQTVHPWDLPVGAIYLGSVVAEAGEPPQTVAKTGNPSAPESQQTTYKAYESEQDPTLEAISDYTDDLKTEQSAHPYIG